MDYHECDEMLSLCCPAFHHLYAAAFRRAESLRFGQGNVIAERSILQVSRATLNTFRTSYANEKSGGPVQCDSSFGDEAVNFVESSAVVNAVLGLEGLGL
jgi:hypothetical protein